MLNHGKTDIGIKINVPGTGNYIFIFPDSLLTGTIQVRDKDGTALWSKTDCDALDIPFAIEIAKRGVQTGIFEN